MFVLVLAVIVISALTGLGVKYFLEYRNLDSRITWREYAIGMAASPVITIVVSWAGWSLARHNQVTFTEYWNGWETAAVIESTICERDGSCKWNYDCDPYIVRVPYDCNCKTSKNGTTKCDTCYRSETHYHSCPYIDKEYHYYVDTTLGRYTIRKNMFPENPQSHRFRTGIRIPQDVISSAGIGKPPFWIAVFDRCQANQPGPVTIRRDYPNYILASEHTLMKEYSSDIADYGARNLMPALSKDINSFYLANKVYFVGWRPNDEYSWQEASRYLNGHLGEVQGDLHLVLVKDGTVDKNPERYSLALKAHWQDKKIFGNNSLSKNAVVVVVGTDDGDVVSWSRAFTGMPLGNERFIVSMRDGLRGIALRPEALLGPNFSRRDGGRVIYPPNNRLGLIQTVLDGSQDPATKFKRVSMSGKDGQGGFLYLKNEIQPSTGQMWAIFILTFLLTCGAWVWGARNYDPSEGGSAWRRRR